MNKETGTGCLAHSSGLSLPARTPGGRSFLLCELCEVSTSLPGGDEIINMKVAHSMLAPLSGEQAGSAWCQGGVPLLP